MVIGFDLDGTLIDSLDFSAQWMTKAASLALGQPVSEAEVRAHFGKPEPAIFRDLLKDEIAERAFAHYQEIFRENCHELKLYANVLETLGFLQEAKIPLALFTSRGAWGTSEILTRHALAPFFSFVLTGEDVEHVKPHPEGILKICEYFQHPPARFLYLGDSPADVQCADHAGAISYQALWAKGVIPYGSRQLRSIDELRSVLPRW